MRISIFGLGYVGLVSAGCLSGKGHAVVGVDVNPAKVDMVNQGLTPIIEAELSGLISTGVERGLLRAVHDAGEAVLASDVHLVCVGTPSSRNGNIDLGAVERVCGQIGTALAQKAEFSVVVTRCTMLPGTIEEMVIPLLERASGKRAGKDFGVCVNPEFLREGSAVHDFHYPPKIVIGFKDERSAAMVADIYAGLESRVFMTPYRTAEMIKYADNSWHALKVAFSNEIGTVCGGLGISAQEVMDIFCSDTKLNISAAYLRPGFAFGGSCLPKDIRALVYKARQNDLELPVLENILVSNARHIDRAFRSVTRGGVRRIGILGLSFKAGTDDLRESPVVELVERLIGKGYDLKVYDRNVSMASLVGANKEYILQKIPHIFRLMTGSIDLVLEHAETVVLANSASEFAGALSRLLPGQRVVDLTGTFELGGQEGRGEGSRGRDGLGAAKRQCVG
jgi:GDP-mannose 6-dehydrogenase